MRKILLGLVAVLFFCGVNFSYAENLKLGFINLKKTLDNYAKVKDGESELVKQAKGKEQEREKQVNEIKGMREKIDLLKDKSKEKKQQELDEKVKKLQDFTYQTRTSLQQNRDEKFRDIMKEVKTVIEEYGQSRSYNIIIDDTLLFYKDAGLDVTDDIVKMLNQRYKKQ